MRRGEQGAAQSAACRMVARVAVASRVQRLSFNRAAGSEEIRSRGRRSRPTRRYTSRHMSLQFFRLKAEATLSLWMVGAALVLAGEAAAQDWPQFLGPTRDGVYKGAPLAETWPAGGPRVVWRKMVGQGFSGPIVAQGRVILFHRVGNE